MKKILVLLLSLSLHCTIQAEENTEAKEGPCSQLMDACKAADYAKGDQTMKRSLYKDCMQPLLSNPSKPVAGVVVDEQIIAACRKIKDAKKTK